MMYSVPEAGKLYVHPRSHVCIYYNVFKKHVFDGHLLAGKETIPNPSSSIDQRYVQHLHAMHTSCSTLHTHAYIYTGEIANPEA